MWPVHAAHLPGIIVETFEPAGEKSCALLTFELQSRKRSSDYILPIVYSSAQPKFILKRTKLPTPKEPEIQKKQEVVVEKKLINYPGELYKMNPLTFDKSLVANRQVMLTNIEGDKSKPDSIFYYLRLVELYNKIEVTF